MKTLSLRLVALTGALFAVGCAANAHDDANDAVASEEKLTAPTAGCAGLRLELANADDAVESAALQTFDDRFLLPEMGYAPRVKIPRALTIFHAGAFAPGRIAVFGAPGLWSDGAAMMLALDGSGVVGGSGQANAAAKAIYDAMTKVATTSTSAAGSTFSARKSADGTFRCERLVREGSDDSYSCAIRALEARDLVGLRVETLLTCE